MDNKTYFDNLRLQYESLKKMQLDNNVLSFKSNNGNYFVKLKIELTKLSPSIFVLSPEQILNTLYIYQLFYNENINEIENKLIEQYISSYNDYAILKNKNPEQFDDNILFALSIPIYSAYNEEFINTPASKVIQEHYNKLNTQIESEFNSSKDLTRKLKLGDLPSTEAYLDYEEFSNKLINIQNAGFTTIFLIAFTVVTTIVYLIIS